MMLGVNEEAMYDCMQSLHDVLQEEVTHVRMRRAGLGPIGRGNALVEVRPHFIFHSAGAVLSRAV